MHIKNASSDIKLKNLSFGDIWRSLDMFINKADDPDKVAITLARLMYKVAFMLCHTPIKQKFYSDTLNVNHENRPLFMFDKEKLTDEEKELLELSIISIDENGKDIEISLEAFILYIDLLSANEDCKYFYREYLNKDYILKSNDKKPEEILVEDLREKIYWSANTGRINSILTHMNVIKNIYDGTSHYHLLESAVTKRGVFHIRNDEELIKFLNK